MVDELRKFGVRYRWSTGGFDWAKQTSSKTVTKGVRKIAYLENRYCGVGANNLIVGSDDAEHWHTEQSPCPPDTAWNDVFSGDGVFVTVGDKGRAATAEPGKTWTQLSLPTTGDLLCGVFDKEHYVVAGESGLCVTATRLNDWVVRTLPTNATVHVAFWNKHACVLATDAGQLVISATAAEALGLYDEDTGLGPSNDDPAPLAVLAFCRLLNTYSRADHIHPWTEEVLKSTVGKPNGVAAVDENNILERKHWPPVDGVIQEVVDIARTGRKFEQVFSPFHRGPGLSSIIHDADHFTDTSGNYYVMVGEAGIGYANDPMVWKPADNQPFGTVPAIGCRFGEDDSNEIVCVSIDTEHRITISRDFGKTWSEPFDAGSGGKLFFAVFFEQIGECFAFRLGSAGFLAGYYATDDAFDFGFPL